MKPAAKSPGPRPNPPPGAKPRPLRQVVWLLSLVVVAAALGSGVYWFIGVARLHAAIPSAPDLAGKPAALIDRLHAATARARSFGGAAAGLADLGRLYQENGYSTRAARCWRALRTAQPGNARWPYYLADLARAEGDYSEMVADLELTVQLDPRYAPAWLQLGEYQLKTGKLDAATRSFQKRLDLLPGDPYARLWLARVAQQQHDPARARQFVEALVHDNPEISSGHNLYAEILAAAGDQAAAERQRWLGRETIRFREADDPWLDELKPFCYDFEQLCIWGTIEYQTQRGDAAKRYFSRAIEIRPDDPVAYEYLATVYLKLNDAAKARDILEEGLAKSRHSQHKPTPMFYINLSHAYRLLKEPAKAVQAARDGLAQDGDEFELYDALGMALGDLGKHDEAVTALEAAVHRSPYDANANYNLALALLSVNRGPEAIEALQRSLVKQPTYPNSLLLLGRMALAAKNWTGAAKSLHPLYESHPEMPEARAAMAELDLGLGEAAEARGDKPEAEKQYRAGLAIDPNRAELQVRLGLLCLLQNRFADAVEPFENYHRLQPKNAQSCLFLGQTYLMVGRVDDARRLLTEGIKTAELTGQTKTASDCREILQSLQ